MKEKLKSITDKAKERWKKTGKKLKILLGAVLAAAIVAVVVLAITASNQPYTTLFSGLSQSDQTAILTYFSETPSWCRKTVRRP